MTAELIFFIIFAAVAVIAAIMMITRKNPVIAALFLVVNFAGIAGIYILLHAQFVAVVQIIVYAGAIMVLFLFVLMLLRPGNEKGFFEGQPKQRTVALLLGIFLLLQLCYIFFAGNPSEGLNPSVERSVTIGTVSAIGHELYTTYLLPFEAIAFVLLAAAIGALIISKKKLD